MGGQCKRGPGGGGSPEMGGVGVRPWHDRGTAQQGAGRGGAGGWTVWCWGVSGDGREGITTGCSLGMDKMVDGGVQLGGFLEECSV